MPLPGTVVHIAYLRRRLPDALSSLGEEFSVELLEGGGQDKVSRERDFEDFRELCEELCGGMFTASTPWGGKWCGATGAAAADERTTLRIPQGLLSGERAPVPALAGARGRTVKDLEAARVSESTAVVVRYQQFSEYSTLTFDIPPPPAPKSNGDSSSTGDEEGAGAAGSDLEGLFARGDRFLEAVRSAGGWWDRVGPECFLSCVLCSAPAPLDRDGRVAFDVWEMGRAVSHGLNVSSGVPTGAMIRDGEIAMFANYMLQPGSENFHALFLYNEELERLSRGSVYREEKDAWESLSSSGVCSRDMQRFLEMEQYRLLCLCAMPIAKMSFSELDGLKRNVLEGMNRLQSGQADTTAKKLRLLQELIATQTTCESIGVESRDRFQAALAYGDIVERRLENFGAEPILGMKNFRTFVYKRLTPALRTYRSAIANVDEATDAVTRATQLLRTQVELDLQRLNERLVLLGTFISVTSFVFTLIQFTDKILKGQL